MCIVPFGYNTIENRKTCFIFQISEFKIMCYSGRYSDSVLNTTVSGIVKSFDLCSVQTRKNTQFNTTLKTIQH